MHKGLQVMLYLIAYCALAWVCRALPWAPRPLLTPDAVVGLATPWSAIRPAPQRAAPAGSLAWSVPIEAPPAPSAAAKGALPPPVRPGPASWAGFLAKLHELDAGKRDKVRVLHLGDSELVADGTSGSLRRELSGRFGLGGLGFSLAAKPLPWYQREHWRHREGRGLTIYSFVYGKLMGGMYGPGGVAFDADPGATAHTTLSHPVAGKCTVRFLYAELAGGGELDLLADGFSFARVATDSSRNGVGVLEKRFDVCPVDLEVATKTRHTRFYGWSIEYDRPGVVWSSLGVVAARETQLSHYDDEHLIEALSALSPDLIVLTFGLNMASEQYPPPPEYRDEVRAVLTELRNGLHDTACLVTGPYPVGYPKVGGGVNPESNSAEVVSRHQRAAAEAAGCVFLDRFALAGGVEAARRWVAAHPKILTGDYQHLTLEGSERMGRAIGRAILSSYEGLPIDVGRFALEDKQNALGAN